jgi:hypothetical protein
MRALGIGLLALAGVFAASPALANSGGVAGYSGQPSVAYPSGESCNQCHSGGTAPTVTLNGPASLTAGSSAEYTLVVSTALSRAGAGVAATKGVLLTPGTGMRDSFGEMVHNDPQVVSGGSMSFKFTVKAPTSGTAIKLWAVGLAANNANAANGDRATHVTRDITITGGGPPPLDAGTGGGADGGGSGPGVDGGGTGTGGGNGTGTGGGTGDGTGTGDGDGTDPDGDGPLSASPDGEDESAGGSSRRRGAGAEPQSCAATRVGASGFASPIGLGLSAAALLSVARRRRPRS